MTKYRPTKVSPASSAFLTPPNTSPPVFNIVPNVAGVPNWSIRQRKHIRGCVRGCISGVCVNKVLSPYLIFFSIDSLQIVRAYPQSHRHK